jgi:cobalt-zinc-cadmium efflux system outer membrane protein
LEAARAEFAMAVRETLTQVDRVHVQLLYHQADVASQFALLAEAEATLEAAEARRSIDPSGEQHYRKARIERDRILFEVTRHSAEGLYTLQDMMVLLGGLRLRSDQITGALSTDYAVTSGKTDLVSIHPRLRAARAAAEAEEAMLAFRRREWQPDVTVRVGVGWREESDETVPFAGIRMPLPIWNRNQGAIAEGRALVLRAESYVEEVELDLENAVRFNLQQLSEYDTFVHEYRTQIKPDAQAALVETRTRFSAGEASHLELLDSQRVYTAARDTYFAFLLQYNLQLAERRGLEGYEAEALAADFLLNGSPNPRQRK